jgi:hypothetical protein
MMVSPADASDGSIKRKAVHATARDSHRRFDNLATMVFMLCIGFMEP